MKIWLLVVLFVTTANEEVTLDGWSPTQQPSLEICNERKAFLLDYVETVHKLPDGIESVKVVCKEIEWK